MTHNVGVAGARGSTVPVRPAQGRDHLSPAAVSSPATPSLDALFTPTQAAALRDAGYDVIGWVVLP